MSNNIKKLRLRKDLTREQLAEKVGVSAVTIWRYETGDERAFRADNLQAIAKELDVSVDELMSDTLDDVPKIEGLVAVPVISAEMTACCGCGIPATEITSSATEYVYVPKSEIGTNYDDMRQPFAITTDGDSMRGWGIPNGSTVVINPAEPVANMDIALISYCDKLALKKVRYMPDKSVDLLSADGNLIHIPSEDNIPEIFNILGKAMTETSRIHHGL